MCTIILLYKMLQDYPIVIAHNRDELKTRKEGQVPGFISKEPFVIAPQDTDASGTWMGFNEYGVVNSLTNVEQKELKKGAKSRGLLVLDGLKKEDCKSLEEHTLKELETNPFNYFSLLYADKNSAQILRYDGKENIHKLEKGLHILPSSQLDDGNNPVRRKERIQEIYHTNEPQGIERILYRIKTICKDHYEGEGGSKESVCTHSEKRNTISSTIIAVGRNINQSKIYHAQGAPCKNDYRDYSYLVRDLK